MAMKMEFLSRLRQQREENGDEAPAEKPKEKRNILLERLLQKKSRSEEESRPEESVSVNDEEQIPEQVTEEAEEEILEIREPEETEEEEIISPEDDSCRIELKDEPDSGDEEESEEPENVAEAGEEAEIPREKPKRGRKKKGTAKEQETESAAEFGEINVIGQKMKLEEAESLVRESFETEDWINAKNRYTEAFGKIHPAADMTPAVLRFEMQAIMDLMAEIAIPLADTKGLLDALNDENNGLCVAIRKLAGAEGANEQARTANGYNALKRYNWNGQEINLLSLVAALKIKFNFLNSLDRRLQLMAGMCNTVCGTLKIEENLQ